MVRRILAVDDNEIVGWTLRARLWSAGYDVLSVASAADAFFALEADRFDLILLDLEMPGIGGMEALAGFKARGLIRETPVLLLTASDELRHMQQARELGAVGYLTKAHANRALLQCLERLFASPSVIWFDDQTWVYPPPNGSQNPTAIAALSLLNDVNKAARRVG